MCYHEARSARFIGHCWGRGWRDAAENLLQTSVINRLGSFPLRRICGTDKKKLFLFLCASRFRWWWWWCWGCWGGDSGAWGKGSRGAKKQTNKTQAASYKSSQTTTPEKSWQQALFFFVLKTRANPRKEKEPMAAYWTNPHYYTNAPCEKRWYVRVDAPHSFRR